MELVEDAETAGWLEGLAGSPEDFDWDAGNRVKNRKHGVESSDVESLFMRPILFAGRIVKPSQVGTRAGRQWARTGPDFHKTRPAITCRELSAHAARREEAL